MTLLGFGAPPAGAGPVCVGDCNADATVAINELIVGVNIALGSQAVTACEAFACQGDGTVPINCLIQGVNSALNGCAGEPTVPLTGSCAEPGSASNGLAPCEVGTPITVFRCDERSECLHQQGLTVLAATTVASGGNWSVQIPMADASATLVVQADITPTIAYRTLVFGVTDGARRAGLTGGATGAPADITPATEAAVELLDSEGFENFSDSAAQQVMDAVAEATADLSFDGLTPEAAAALALNTASADPTVMTVLQTARNTPTPTVASASTPTNTPPNATPTTTPIRFVDNGDGTITDHQTGLTWEKKDFSGGLHDVRVRVLWAGRCLNTTDYCQPDDPAEVTCNAATSGAFGCGHCTGTACILSAGQFGSTIWGWHNMLNATNFAGHNDWRIPTVAESGGMAELETLVDLTIRGCRNFQENACIAPPFNTGCPESGCAVTTCSCTEANGYWSATTHAEAGHVAWGVNFLDGTLGFQAKEATFRVRAVRGGS